MAFNTADLAGFLVEREGETGNPGAERRIDCRHAGARIRRAADNLLLAIPGVDRADAQPISIGMRFGFLHLGDGERRQLFCRVLDMLHLKAGLQHHGEDVL